MTAVLAQWNRLPLEEAAKQIFSCCGSQAWAMEMAARRPFPDVTTLLAAGDETWSNLTATDWTEAFRGHPRIGESRAEQSGSVQSVTWSAQEQRNIEAAGEAVKIRLAEANREYEELFRHIFIVCAAGKSAPEILEILRRRLKNDEHTELREAAEQQRQIMHIRIKKWLSE